MTKTKTKETNYSGIHLWDEILKGIVSTMPQQLFPLFKEVFGKVYQQQAQQERQEPGPDPWS